MTNNRWSTANPAGQGAGILAATLAVATRTLRKYLRSPQLLVFNLLGSAIFLVLFRYIFGGAIHLPGISYVEFLVPGFILTSGLIAGTTVAPAVAEDTAQGIFDRFRSLPAPRTALAAGRVLGDTAAIAVNIAVTAAFGFAVGFRLHASVAAALAAYGVCILAAFAFVWLFCWMGLVAGSAQAAQGMTFTIYLLLFVSDAWVRADTLPRWLQPIAAHQPVSVMANAVRALALGGPDPAGLAHSTGYWVLLTLAWSAGIVTVFAPLIAWRYARAE